jgi:hypothetical protein
MIWYVLIVVTYVNSGVTVSQKDYFSKEACEAAAIVVHQAAKDVRGWMNETNLQTRCVRKG